MNRIYALIKKSPALFLLCEGTRRSLHAAEKGDLIRQKIYWDLDLGLPRFWESEK
jgi:hypothetical protein